MPAKILFIGPHRPNRNASQRFRMEQFFPYLKQAGFQCDYSWFIDEEDDIIFYGKENGWGKLKIYLKAIRVRLRDVLRANRYDIIFIQRETFMTGSVFFERKFSRSKARVIFDFDDAIWLQDVSAANKGLSWLKQPGKIAAIIKMSDTVIAGNSFLAEYASQFNAHVRIIPTVIDTSVYLPSLKNQFTARPVSIGWIGSKTTVKYFETILPVLKKLEEKYGERIRLKLIGDKNLLVNHLPIEYIRWHVENEVSDLQKLDIGVMPLPDDVWSKGKCGFKALQYMALEIPPVISPVGMNMEIVQHGENGFLAGTEEEWIDYLSQLIESSELRKKMGMLARQTVIEKYSVQAQLPALISILNKP